LRIPTLPPSPRMPRDEHTYSTHPERLFQSRGGPGGPDRPASSSRSTSGCFTCRLRRKKCSNQMGDGACETCLRLDIECLGYGKKLPKWVKEKRKEIVEKLKLPRQLREVEDRRDLKSFYMPENWVPNHGTHSPSPASETEGSETTRSPAVATEATSLAEGYFADSMSPIDWTGVASGMEAETSLGLSTPSTLFLNFHQSPSPGQEGIDFLEQLAQRCDNYLNSI